MYPAGNLLIPVPHGQLEAIVKETASETTAGAALVLHPLPTAGGTMHNKVVFRAAAALNEAGLLTLRINFRGVGQSTGEFDQGRGELEDARAGLKYLVDNHPSLPLTVCGFSFGARVGTELGMSDDRVQYLISLGTPVNKYSFSFLKDCRKPILFIHGEFDEFGGLARLQDLVDELKGRTDAQLIIIPGADHFFEGQLKEVKRAILDWVTARLSERHATGTRYL
jgi:alpha/beta superfamily hydrolase